MRWGTRGKDQEKHLLEKYIAEICEEKRVDTACGVLEVKGSAWQSGKIKHNIRARNGIEDWFTICRPTTIIMRCT